MQPDAKGVTLATVNSSPTPDQPAATPAEQVFTVPRAHFFAGDWPQGFTPLSGTAATELLERFAAAGSFMLRERAEQDPSHKQPIPYCILRAPGAAFCVQRLKAQSEARLHGKMSLGIGGHINPEPSQTLENAGSKERDETPNTVAQQSATLFERTLQRELSEELIGVDGHQPHAQLLGLLNDDSNPVGKVHVGLVYAIDWLDLKRAKDQVAVRETDKMQGGFRSLAELRKLWQDPDRLETWSRTLIAAGLFEASAVPR